MEVGILLLVGVLLPLLLTRSPTEDERPEPPYRTAVMTRLEICEHFMFGGGLVRDAEMRDTICDGLVSEIYRSEWDVLKFDELDDGEENKPPTPCYTYEEYKNAQFDYYDLDGAGIKTKGYDELMLLQGFERLEKQYPISIGPYRLKADNIWFNQWGYPKGNRFMFVGCVNGVPYWALKRESIVSYDGAWNLVLNKMLRQFVRGKGEAPSERTHLRDIQAIQSGDYEEDIFTLPREEMMQNGLGQFHEGHVGDYRESPSYPEDAYDTRTNQYLYDMSKW